MRQSAHGYRQPCRALNSWRSEMIAALAFLGGVGIGFLIAALCNAAGMRDMCADCGVWRAYHDMIHGGVGDGESDVR